MSPPRRLAWTCLILAAAIAAGCARAADEQTVAADLQKRLDQELKPGLFKLVGLRREGSAPMPAGESGASRVIVYFNTTLQLAQDYAFGGWDQLSPASVAYALGATEKGVFGLAAQNKSGQTVRAYGSVLYEETPKGWIAVAGVPTETAAAPNTDSSGTPLRSKELIDKLAAMVNLPPPGVTPQQDAIIADELARASENIERRVQRRAQTFTLATGREGSEYERFGRSLIEAVNAVAPSVKLRQRESDGSVENARVLARGEADYGIIQGDVAAAAFTGEDVFAQTGSLANLRAVGGLFPEAIHVIVLGDSPVRGVAELRGKRVGIGAPASGTRFDALAVLEAHGLKPADLAESSEEVPAAAIGRLKRRQLDAIFLTTGAPSPLLQPAAASPGLRLLPISDAVMPRLLERRTGLTQLTLAANTYPRQPDPVRTVASTALLVTTADTPEGEVARVADLVFTKMQTQGGAYAGVIRVSPHTERRGITIPLHAGVAGRGKDDTVSTTGKK
jgi:TRAP transporter TAXI family solute receptor